GLVQRVSVNGTDFARFAGKARLRQGLGLLPDLVLEQAGKLKEESYFIRTRWLVASELQNHVRTLVRKGTKAGTISLIVSRIRFGTLSQMLADCKSDRMPSRTWLKKVSDWNTSSPAFKK